MTGTGQWKLDPEVETLHKPYIPGLDCKRNHRRRHKKHRRRRARVKYPIKVSGYDFNDIYIYLQKKKSVKI